MYTALLIMLGGIILGRLCRPWISLPLIRKLLLAAILLLLFLLGISIGANSKLMEKLPSIGLQALILMLFCVGGSIAISLLITPVLRKYLFQAPREGTGKDRHA